MSAETKKIKLNINISFDLYEALTVIKIQRGIETDQALDSLLRENADVKKALEEIKAEPDVGVFVVGPRMRQHMAEKAPTS